MATAATHRPVYGHSLQAEALSLLARLTDAHHKLLEAMSALAAITQQIEPDREGYTTARWRLSKASRIRRTTWEEAVALLAGRVDDAEAALIANLQKSNYELREASAKHISLWTAERIDLDWIGYCEASRTIRWKMMSVVRHERRLIFPMLERISRN